MQSWLILNDLQIPFQDKPVVDLVLRFAEKVKPDGVILNGDVTDCYAISDFVKDPMKRKDLLKEIEQAGKLMARLKFIKQRIWIGGNHEDRLRRYLWKNAAALAGIGGMDFNEVFALNKFGFHWIPYGQGTFLGKLFVTHGVIVRRHSAYSARAHFEKYGISVLVGHTHRLGAYYHRDMNGTFVSYENGCLCRLDPEYDAYPDWQQGISMVHVDPKSKLFRVEQIPILNRKELIYGGRLYT